MDAASVDIQFSDGSVLSIYCPDVEDEITHTPVQRAEPDWLIDNEPLAYAAMVWIKILKKAATRERQPYKEM